MKVVNQLSLCLAVVTLGLFPQTFNQAQQSASPATAQSDELAVYGAALETHKKLGASSRLLIADKTSTFACEDLTRNGLSIGGCNGLRSIDESPAERLAIVKRDLPELQTSTALDFAARNEASVPIQSGIPFASKYYLFSDTNIPKDWKYSYLIYFSRVGFNSDRSQALVNVGIFSATDAKDSEGKYFMLKKVSGKWVLGGGSAVWQLAPSR